MRPSLETDVEHGAPPVVLNLVNLQNLAPSSQEKLEEKVETLDVFQKDEITFPEGGLRGWMAVLGGFLVQYCCLGYITSFGAYQDFYVRKYLTAYTPSTIGWIGGIQIFLAFSSGVVSGRLFDKGYFRVMMITTIILYAIGLYSLSFSHENSYYQVFLSHGIAFGLATGVTYIPSIAIAGHYFHKKRALAVGIISSGSALGAVVQPIMLNKFFNGKIGFHNGVRISASMNIALLVVATFLARTRLPPKKTQKAVSIPSLLKEPAYISLVAASVFAFLGLFYPFFYIQLNAITHHVDKELAFYSTSILNAASIFGRWIPGLAAPYIGILNIGTFTTFGTGVVIFTMIAVHDKTGTILFAIFFGIFSGSLIASTPAMSARHAKDHTEIGVRMGLFFAVGGIVGLFATPIAGALLTSHYLWLRPSVFAGITTCLGGICCGIARVVTAKQEKTWKV